MIFTENLKKAQSGDEYAYKLVCNEFADGLYTAARLTLNTSEDAQAAVRDAFSDGFATVKQIKDRDHLRAWLAHELAKHIVSALKKYRDEGEPQLDVGDALPVRGLDDAEAALFVKIRRDVFGRLAGLDRLTGALNGVFGYDCREISIITGLSEEAAARKLANTEKAYSAAGLQMSAGIGLFTRVKAPEGLYTPEKARAIPFEPSVLSEQTEHEKNVKIAFADISEPVQAAQTPAETLREEGAEAEREDITGQNGQKDEPKAPPREIDARMFIGIISAQHIKGGEFLQLMGNTRISNSAYREIEQNPNLTKERLIALLEESGLTTADYYKLLTAVKLRKDLDTASTRAFTLRESENIKQAEYGETAFSSAEQEESKPVKPPVLTPEGGLEPVSEPASEENAVMETLGEIAAEREEKPEKPLVLPHESRESRESEPAAPDLSVTAMLGEIPTAREEVKPAKPLVLPHETHENREAEPAAPDLSVTTMLGEIPTEREEFKAVKPPIITPDEQKRHEPVSVAVSEKPFAPDKPRAAENPLVTAAAETDGREKYKSNEFFYDDDAYEPGVNNGKIAFCAVCAILLFAGSFLCRYLNTGSPLPTEKPAEVAAESDKNAGITSEDIVTDEDVAAAIGRLTLNESRNELDEYYAGQAYENALTSDFAEVGDTVYIYCKGKLTATDISGEEPNLSAEAELTASGKFLGFTADEEHVYALTQTENGDGEAVTAEIFDIRLKPLGTYTQDGELAAVHKYDGTLTIFTALNTAGRENPLPTYEIDGESKTLTVSEIEVPNGVMYNSFAVFGTLSGSDVRTRAVLGGYDAYASGDGDSFSLIIPDFNKTYVRRYRIVGLNAELQTEELINGELYGAQCYSAENGTAVACDSAEGCITIQKKTESGYAKAASLGAGETLRGAAFSDGLTYVITENADGASTLYCCGEDGSELTPDPEAVYTGRLAEYGENLVGLSATADESGARTGLRLSVYGYDEKLTEIYGTDISVDETTAAEYVRYLSGDAEENSALIALGGDYAAVSCVYFDGVSEIERFLCFKHNGNGFETASDLLLFDIQSDYRYMTIRGEKLYIFTDSTIVTADLSTGKATGYYTIDG